MKSSDCMNCRNEIFGLSAIWIVLFHVNNYLPTGGGLFRILSIGNLGVDIFLFLSAIGLSMSYAKNDLRHFYLHRVKRVLLPYLLAACLFFIWYDFCFSQDGLVGFILNITTIQYWINGIFPVWYVAFILVLYLLYPLLYSVNKRTNGVGIFALIAAAIIIEAALMYFESPFYTHCERAISRVPIFLLGIGMSEFFCRDKKIPNGIVALCFFVGCLLAYCVPRISGISIILMRYAYGIIGICIIICYSWIRKKTSLGVFARLLGWLGTISLEIYVTHVLAIQIINAGELWGQLPGIAWYFLVPAAGILLGKLLQIATKRILTFSHLNEAGNRKEMKLCAEQNETDH